MGLYEFISVELMCFGKIECEWDNVIRKNRTKESAKDYVLGDNFCVPYSRLLNRNIPSYRCCCCVNGE